MAKQPSIADHAIIGDLQTAALVASNGDVDWFCAPRFDSPSVFASLLDSDRGGRFRIAPEGDDVVTKQGYLGDTAVLATRFMTEEGTGSVIDFMQVSEPNVVSDRHSIVRLVRARAGQDAVPGVVRSPLRLRTHLAYGGADPRRCRVRVGRVPPGPSRRGAAATGRPGRGGLVRGA